MADLNQIWEWNPFTGDPYIPPVDSPNRRYCPTPEEMDELVRTNITVSNELKEELWRFMTSNEPRLTTAFDPAQTPVLRGYLRFLRSLNFKKVRFEWFSDGRLRMDKLQRDTPFDGTPDGINQLRSSQTSSRYVLVEDLNHNARHGWTGSGTFPCGFALCNLCQHVGGSATVNLGRGRQLQLSKRASCDTWNAVYVGVCQQCENEGTFAIYFGETGQLLSTRCSKHTTDPCNSYSALKNLPLKTVQARRAEVARIINNEEDPDEVLRDWFSHVTVGGIHPGQQRMSVVDIIPHPFLRKNRERNLVAEHMFHDGDFDYLRRGRGCLNMYGVN